MYKYANYKITFWAKPIPIRSFDYDFAHEEYDLDDPRMGAASSIENAIKEINEIELELECETKARFENSIYW